MTSKVDKFHWAKRVSRRDIQLLYQSDAQGLLDNELLEKVNYTIYARVSDMFEVRDAQQFGRVKCRQCSEMLEKPFQMGSGNKSTVLKCGHCDWQVTCGEYFESYSGKSMLPGSMAELFEIYLERFPGAKSSQEKMILIDWLIHQFHVMQGVAGKTVAENVIQGSKEQVIELIENLAYGPASTPGLVSLGKWREVNYDPVRLFKQTHSHREVQEIARKLEIKECSQISEDELIPEILRLAPDLADKKLQAVQKE